jgi:hypothetical protein
MDDGAAVECEPHNLGTYDRSAEAGFCIQADTAGEGCQLGRITAWARVEDSLPAQAVGALTLDHVISLPPCCQSFLEMERTCHNEDRGT